MDTEKYFYDFLNRCIPLLTKEGVEKLRDSSVAIAGCGGAGGASAITLARMGVSNFKLADPGVVDAPDINRQWAANTTTLGMNKTEAYRKMLLDINPEMSVTKYPEGVTESNVEDFLEGVDLVIDCLDISVSTQLRTKVYEQARKNGIYSFASIILSFGAIFYCSSPTGMSMDIMERGLDGSSKGTKFPSFLSEVFMSQHLDIIESKVQTHKIPSVPISVMVAAAIICTESILMLLGNIIPGARKPVCLPKVILADFFKLSYYVVDIESIPLE